jgi:hypothetical protein
MIRHFLTRLIGTPQTAGSLLAQHGARARREAVKAKARAMRAEMGLPPLEALRP